MTEPTFTPATDVIEVYKDGSGSVVVAKAGQPMTYTRAQMLGIMRDDGIPRVDGASVGGMRIVTEPGGRPLVIVTDSGGGPLASEEIRDGQGAVVARAKRPRKAKVQ
jgi:hypothetical protein